MGTLDLRRLGSRAALIAVTLVATACGGPLDNRLLTGEGMDPYKASLAALEGEASEFELEAFNWAVSDFDLDRLHREYPDSTPRKIIRAEVGKAKKTYPDRIAAKKEEAKAQEPVREELAKIAATDTTFFIDKNFFGQQPKIRASIINGSSLPISSLNWRATLYVDDAMEPAATTVLTNDYRKDGGLEPGARYTVTFKVGFVRGDDRWTTLEIQNAKATRVVLEAIPGSVMDFADRPYLSTDAAGQVVLLQATLDAAEKFSSI